MKILQWFLNHQVQILATVATINALLRLVPTARWATLESEFPRLASIARLMRAMGPDVVKGVRAVYAIWRGNSLPSMGPSVPLVCLLALSLSVGACTGQARWTAEAVANAVADTANEGGERVLTDYCSDSMRALGREGDYVGGTCHETGPRAGLTASEEEITALRDTRARWRPVIVAHTDLAAAHGELLSILALGTHADAGAIFAALGNLARLYTVLASTAALLGTQLPTLPGGLGQ